MYSGRGAVRIAWGAALAALCLGASLSPLGCGGDSPTISKADFIARADRICVGTVKHYNLARLIAARQSGYNAPAFAEKQLSAILEEEIEAIRGLGAPSGDERYIERLLTAMQGAVNEAREHPYHWVHRFDNPYAKAETLSNRYGLAKCPGIV